MAEPLFFMTPQNPYKPSVVESRADPGPPPRYRMLASLLALSAALIAYRYVPLFIGFQRADMTLFHWIAIFAPTVYLLAASCLGAVGEYRGSATISSSLPIILAPTLMIAMWIMFGFYWERDFASFGFSSLFYAGPQAIVVFLAPLYYCLSFVRARSTSIARSG
ncbi:hypothetical protein SAMN06265222_12919 [Neorhodopirellula lusitana]|uniref:Transmembrane protein n=1 Tax=Neorhodopirellula lusitana TaxID=445327 RepID=A0ABY1QRY0_9BACT|nr:hypothetical protein [Neorhodopirellula lusitana]SMP79132.1 hypothetical protein SAMN06265222_12919 [Neorhodopirellula lusitana]